MTASKEATTIFSLAATSLYGSRTSEIFLLIVPVPATSNYQCDTTFSWSHEPLLQGIEELR